MKIKAPNIEFIAFKDGVCDIYYEDEDGNKVEKYVALGFEKSILGFKRHFSAKAVNVDISKVIKIPMVQGIDNYDTVEIKNEGKDKIELIQEKNDTNPPSQDITLKRI